VRRCLPLLLAAVLLTGACSESFSAIRLGVPVTMGSPATQPAAGDRFKVNATSVHALFGLFTLSRASLDKALAAQLVGGRGVADVTIKVRSRWSDLLISGLTLGLFIPRTVTFEGVITGTPAAAPVSQPPSP
jgi:hypothetical protein